MCGTLRWTDPLPRLFWCTDRLIDGLVNGIVDWWRCTDPLLDLTWCTDRLIDGLVNGIVDWWRCTDPLPDLTWCTDWLMAWLMESLTVEMYQAIAWPYLMYRLIDGLVNGIIDWWRCTKPLPDLTWCTDWLMAWLMESLTGGDVPSHCLTLLDVQIDWWPG